MSAVPRGVPRHWITRHWITRAGATIAAITLGGLGGARAAEPDKDCFPKVTEACAVRAVFGGDEVDLSFAMARLKEAEGPAAIREAQILVEQLRHAEALVSKARTLREAGDNDRAVEREARFVIMGRRFLGPAVGSVVLDLVPVVRTAYVDLATKLLLRGNGLGARRALDIAAQVDPGAQEVERAEVQLLQTARAAYLKGYGIYRDSGTDQLRVARRLWRFAVDTSPRDSATRIKAAALLEETNP